MPAAAETSVDPKPKKDAKGRFAPGNSGGPGNPFARQLADLRKMALEVVNPDELRELLQALLQRAKDGDNAAAKILLQHTLGKPTAPIDPDRIEIDECRLRAESAIPTTEWMADLMHLPAADVNEYADILGPPLQQAAIAPFKAGLDAMNAAPPGEEMKAARKAIRRELRRQRSPLPNGDNGADPFDPVAGLGRSAAGPNGPSWVG
jgi:hypothetical protein